MIEEKSLDVFATKLAQLRELFPEVLSEGKIDFKRLRDVLGDEVAFHNEHYELSWAGKSEARAEIQKQTSATLVPNGGINAESCNNIFIEGENLEVLRTLQRSYFGKIKMIYIDPPYNTGNDSFVYPDDYSERQDEFKKRTGITDKNGFLNKQDLWKENRKENGHFHSVWLSMMYPRLYLARNLLREDGVIFISIDDNEQANLKQLCDEIFGEENFVADCIRAGNSSKNNAKHFSISHDYTLIYAKNIEFLNIKNVKKNNIDEFYRRIKKLANELDDFSEISNEIRMLTKYPRFYDFDHYTNYDENGVFRANDLTAINSKNDFDIIHPITNKPCKKSNRGWAYNKEGIKKLIAENKILFGENENTVPQLKCYLEDSQTQVPKSIFFTDAQVDTKWLKKQNIPFEFSKPVEFINLLLESSTDAKDIILDFFAGSGTTAHAVLDLNEQDGGNRQFICVQMPEPLEETSEAYKAGYKTIADICKARISKVIEKIQTERDSKAQDDMIPTEPKQALGFKSYTLSPSNFKQWRSDADQQTILEQLDLHLHSEKPDSENQNMLVELLLKSGRPLTAQVETISLDNQTLYNIEQGSLLIFFDTFTEAVKDFIFTLKPKKVVCLDRVFQDDKTLTNFKLGLKDAGIELQII